MRGPRGTPRAFGIAVVSALAALVVLGTGMAGYVEAGLGDGQGLWGTVGRVLAPWSVAVLLCALTVTLHAFACHAVFIEYLDCSFSRLRLILGMLVIVLAHAAEIQIFGVGLYAYADAVGETLGGVSQGRLIDYLYFSYANYTSLGFGDIYAEESMRLIAGVEALTGLLMIGWSASMTVVVFRREWFK